MEKRCDLGYGPHFRRAEGLSLLVLQAEATVISPTPIQSHCLSMLNTAGPTLTWRQESGKNYMSEIHL